MRTHRWMGLSSALIALLLFSAPLSRGVAGERAVPRPAGELVLHQDLLVPPGDGIAYLQFGQVVELRELAEFEPYCQFELYRANLLAVPVHAGSFVIDRSAPVTDPTGIVSRSYQVADGGDGGGPGFYYQGREFYLSGEGAPPVWRLVCQQLVEHWDNDEPDLAVMQAQLGAVMTLTPR